MGSQRGEASLFLPRELVRTLKNRLRLKSNVEVVRRGLYLLKETTDRAALREAYRKASEAVRAESSSDLAELDRLSNEGLD
jgi:hypothetical protein